MVTTEDVVVVSPTGTSPDERVAWSTSGYLAVLGGLVLVAVGIWLCTLQGAGAHWAAAALFVVATLLFVGLTSVQPGQARVVTLFGRYAGTVRMTGLRWVNPFTARRQISLRIRNHESTTVKVNDAEGNPIEMAAVMVWQVRDSARAMFAVDDFVTFVVTQAETAIRHIANTTPYEAPSSGGLSLRDDTDQVTRLLAAEIAARVAAAGVEVVEARITRLSYAPEIAQVMLQRQQAGAVVAARSRIVDGAVGMVQMALNRLAEEDIVELDEERKATMVSNLLVVLCGDRGTQPVVNIGSLYQ
jgi:regulator of protease activity HflC (stomatin/prohibitin superfamily)